MGSVFRNPVYPSRCSDRREQVICIVGRQTGESVDIRLPARTRTGRCFSFQHRGPWTPKVTMTRIPVIRSLLIFQMADCEESLLVCPCKCGRIARGRRKADKNAGETLDHPQSLCLTLSIGLYPWIYVFLDLFFHYDLIRNLLRWFFS